MPARFELHGVCLFGPDLQGRPHPVAHAGEPFDYVHVNMMAGEHKQPPHLSRQRYGQVPLLRRPQQRPPSVPVGGDPRIPRRHDRQVRRRRLSTSGCRRASGSTGISTASPRRCTGARDQAGLPQGSARGGRDCVQDGKAGLERPRSASRRPQLARRGGHRPLPTSTSMASSPSRARRGSTLPIILRSWPGRSASRRCPASGAGGPAAAWNRGRPHERPADPRGAGRRSRGDHPPARGGRTGLARRPAGRRRRGRPTRPPSPPSRAAPRTGSSWRSTARRSSARSSSPSSPTSPGAAPCGSRSRA